MRWKYKSFIALLYLCSATFIVFFVMAILSSLFGYWIGNGENIAYFFYDRLLNYFKVGLAGIWIGLIIWFFYYRKI